MTCLALLMALVFCEPDERYVVRDYVDAGIGLYVREYVFDGIEFVENFQLASTDLKDDAIDTYSYPLLVSINRKPYLVACDAQCFLVPY